MQGAFEDYVYIADLPKTVSTKEIQDYFRQSLKAETAVKLME
jgi:hypothetical protein